MIKRWAYTEQVDQDKVERLSQEININNTLSRILVQRGVTTFEEARKFFRPSLKNLHDPFLMKDMDFAVNRLWEAIKNDEKVLIYGDYDVDGTTSVALLYRFLKNKVAYLNYYINNREDEGYGISEKGIEFAVNQGINLIISVDCGIKAGKQVEMATKHNIDFIICDHHTPGQQLPGAVAVLDPKREDCAYPYKELSGCGIGFKLMEALCIAKKFNLEELYENLDLLAVSIAADIVPITGENRILCYHGLLQLNKNPSPGLAALKNVSTKDEIGISGIVFGIAPRINAAGRISHANGAVELLISQKSEEANENMEPINTHNNERRKEDSSITEEALQMIEPEAGKHKTTVLYKDTWHKGVVGIVASRCIEHYYKPTIILAGTDGQATGSARSVEGFDIYQAILNCSEWLDKFGGHKYAAGLSLPVENLEHFKRAFEREVSKSISEESLIPSLKIDAPLYFNLLNAKFYAILRQMEPFGPGNMTPVFESEGVFVSGDLRILKEKHLKFTVGQRGSQKKFEAIGFNLSSFYDEIRKADSFKIAYTVELNQFYSNNPRLQLNIKDIKTEK